MLYFVSYIHREKRKYFPLSTRGIALYVGSSLIYFSNTRKSLKFYGNYQSNLLNCGLSVQLHMHLVLRFPGNDYVLEC